MKSLSVGGAVMRNESRMPPKRHHTQDPGVPPSAGSAQLEPPTNTTHNNTQHVSQAFHVSSVALFLLF